MAKPKQETFSQKVVLLIIGGIVTVIGSFIVLVFGPKITENKTKLLDSTKNISGDIYTKPAIPSNRAPRKHIIYVEVELNINSNDRVLVNGEPATPYEISEKPNTLKLVSGKKYRIRINNCPEKEIIPVLNQENSVSVCM